MNEAIKQILLITLLLPLTINTGLLLGELLSFYLKKKSNGQGGKKATEIVKSALIIPIFSKPHGKGSIKCHCREVHLELYVTVCLLINLLVCIPPPFAS